MTAAWAAAEAAAWPPGWPVAAASAPVRASRTAVGSSRRCSVRGGRGRGTAAMAAWEAAARRVEPWSR
jgi:hypothetical protein